MAAAKPDPAATAAAKNDAKSDAAAPAAATAVARPTGFKAWLPALLAVLVAPAATWATIEFVLLPRLQQKIATATITLPDGAATAGAAATDHAKAGAKAGKKSSDAPTYDGFQNVVVNLAGTMGTRYLKTSFLVTGSDPNVASIFEGAKPKLHDVTLNVLSSLTLADLEEPGAKNVIREKLVLAYNQALGRRVAEQVYFADFVVQ